MDSIVCLVPASLVSGYVWGLGAMNQIILRSLGVTSQELVFIVCLVPESLVSGYAQRLGASDRSVDHVASRSNPEYPGAHSLPLISRTNNG
jgi:hypothetical protein